MSRKILVEIAVPDNWESRLDMQPWIESEIRADRWLWRWATEASVSELPDRWEKALAALLADVGPPDKIMQPLVDELRAAVQAAIQSTEEETARKCMAILAEYGNRKGIAGIGIRFGVKR